MFEMILRFIVGSGVVLGLLWLTSKLAARYGTKGGGRFRASGGLDVVARRQIARGTSIVRISVDDKDLLLGCSAKGVEMLCELPLTHPVEAPRLVRVPNPIAGSGFAAKLAKAVERVTTQNPGM